MSATAPVVRAAHVRRTPDEAFALFTDEVGAWWPLTTHGLHGSAGSLAFADGALVERSLEGDEVVWAEVTACASCFSSAVRSARAPASSPVRPLN